MYLVNTRPEAANPPELTIFIGNLKTFNVPQSIKMVLAKEFDNNCVAVFFSNLFDNNCFPLRTKLHGLD